MLKNKTKNKIKKIEELNLNKKANLNRIKLKYKRKFVLLILKILLNTIYLSSGQELEEEMEADLHWN
jgi:hypothetical protein